VPKLQVEKKTVDKVKASKNIKAKAKEQDILDACWSGGKMGDKFRSKLMKKMEQVKKLSQSQYPLNLKGAKPLSRATPATKGMGKKNMSSMIVMVQESSRTKGLDGRVLTSRSRRVPALRCITPRVNPANCSFAGKSSAINTSIADSKALSSARESENLKSAGDNSVYKALREQLHKITLKLDMEEYKPEDTEVSGQRQRRTREERSGRNADNKMDKTLPLQTKDTNSQPQGLKSGVLLEKKVKGVKRPLTRNQTNNPIKSYNFHKENLKMKPPIESIYCTTRPPAKSFKKTELGMSKKLSDPNKRAAKKYLLELYERLIYQIKDAERNKKVTDTTKKLKGAIGRCTGSRNNLYNESNSKRSLQPKNLSSKRLLN
jgi:hypothetical protein